MSQNKPCRHSEWSVLGPSTLSICSSCPTVKRLSLSLSPRVDVVSVEREGEVRKSSIIVDERKTRRISERHFIVCGENSCRFIRRLPSFACSSTWWIWQIRRMNIVKYSGFAWLIITRSWLVDWIYWRLLLQLQSIITAHNRWLSQTRPMPYWTMSVISSAWLTWLWFTNKSLMKHEGGMKNEHSLATELTSGRTEYKSPCLTVPLLFCFSLFIRCSGNVVTEPLPSNGHVPCLLQREHAWPAVGWQWTSALATLFWLSGVISQYST
jgi:hypothetical protein